MLLRLSIVAVIVFQAVVGISEVPIALVAVESVRVFCGGCLHETVLVVLVTDGSVAAVNEFKEVAPILYGIVVLLFSIIG